MRTLVCFSLLMLGLGSVGAGDGASTLSGEVVFPQLVRLPSGAVLRVTLEDVSLADAPATELAAQFVEPREDVLRIPFALSYLHSEIDPRHSYAVRAQVRGSDQRLLWTSTTHHGVLTRGHPAGGILVDVVAVAAAAEPDLAPRPRALVFMCGEMELLVRFGHGEIRLYLPGRNVVLAQVRSGSGARYEGEGVLFWNKGAEASLEVDGVRYGGCLRQREP